MSVYGGRAQISPERVNPATPTSVRFGVTASCVARELRRAPKEEQTARGLCRSVRCFARGLIIMGLRPKPRQRVGGAGPAFFANAVSPFQMSFTLINYDLSNYITVLPLGQVKFAPAVLGQQALFLYGISLFMSLGNIEVSRIFDLFNSFIRSLSSPIPSPP